MIKVKIKLKINLMQKAEVEALLQLKFLLILKKSLKLIIIIRRQNKISIRNKLLDYHLLIITQKVFKIPRAMLTFLFQSPEKLSKKLLMGQLIINLIKFHMKIRILQVN